MPAFAERLYPLLMEAAHRPKKPRWLPTLTTSGRSVEQVWLAQRHALVTRSLRSQRIRVRHERMRVPLYPREQL